MAGDNKWQLAFWIITSICGVWMLTLTNGVIANDRLNMTEHRDLRECLYTKLVNIDTRLTRIETKLEK